MRKEKRTVQHSAQALNPMQAQEESQTDWERLDRMTDDELDRAVATDPDWADVPRDWYTRAVPFYPKGPKAQITLRLDQDILIWYKGQGKGYQTRINAVLRAYMDAHKHHDAGTQS